MDLELATSEELIQELVGRSTFVGIVVYDSKAHKSKDQIHTDFNVITNLDEENMLKLLEHTLNNTTMEGGV